MLFKKISLLITNTLAGSGSSGSGSRSSSRTKETAGLIVLGTLVGVLIALFLDYKFGRGWCVYAWKQRRKAKFLVVTFVGRCIYASKQRRKAEEAAVGANPFDDGSAPQRKVPKVFTYEELEKCTDNFSENNERGEGSYGKVYEGYLPNGKVAIKRAKQGSVQGAREFKNEIESLSDVNHKNLVVLVGFCHERGEQMLVYEYMENGTLRDNLVGKRGRQLNWRERLQIALGSARGLAYLHEFIRQPIIHGDIKSTNILLDDSGTAKIADFGLSKLVADIHGSSNVQGTPGYWDPEYFNRQANRTQKSDVYSFGVVMLELITARQPYERGINMVHEIKTAFYHNDQEYYGLRDMMDPKILSQAKNIGLRKFVQLALACTEESALNRPSMNEVVKEIEIILGNDDTLGDEGFVAGDAGASSSH